MDVVSFIVCIYWVGEKGRRGEGGRRGGGVRRWEALVRHGSSNELGEGISRVGGVQLELVQVIQEHTERRFHVGGREDTSTVRRGGVMEGGVSACVWRKYQQQALHAVVHHNKNNNTFITKINRSSVPHANAHTCIGSPAASK